MDISSDEELGSPPRGFKSHGSKVLIVLLGMI